MHYLEGLLGTADSAPILEPDSKAAKWVLEETGAGNLKEAREKAEAVLAGKTVVLQEPPLKQEPFSFVNADMAELERAVLGRAHAAELKTTRYRMALEAIAGSKGRIGISELIRIAEQALGEGN
jgi:hypothetical protein